MNIKYSSVVIFVSDIDRAREFYQKVLGFEIEFDMGNNVILKDGIALWKVGKEHIINKKRGPGRGTKNFELYFETKDIKTFCNKLENRGVKFLHNIEKEPWGQNTMRFYDPDGNIIEVGECLSTFLKRMESRGMSIPEISNLTGMKNKDILDILENRK